jgi:predicted O-methyltransferase YrrM
MSGGTRRDLRFDQYIESAVLLDDKAEKIRQPYTSGTTYSDLLHMPFIFSQGARNVLIIGGGGGVVPMIFKESYPQLSIDVVEIDPVVVEVAEKHFGLAPDARLRVHVQDGRMFVHNSKDRYDLVVLDAYTAGGRIPFHLTTREFLSQVRDRVTPEGIVLMNVISALEGPASKLFRAEYKTFKDVFGKDQVYVFPKITLQDIDAAIKRGEDYRKVSRNVILIATGPAHNRRFRPAELLDAARRLTTAGEVKMGTLPRYAETMFTDPELDAVRQDDVPVLTDDYAPVDRMIVDLED